MADVSAIVLHGPAVFYRGILRAGLARPQRHAAVRARPHVPPRAAGVVLYVRAGTGDRIFRSALLDVHAADVVCQRVDQAHPQRRISTGKRTSLVLPGAADFLADVRRNASPT